MTDAAVSAMPVGRCTVFNTDLLDDADIAPHTAVESDPGATDRRQVAALIEAAAAGNSDAWAAVVTRFSGMVWAVARAHGLTRADSSQVSDTVWTCLVGHLGQIRQPGRAGEWLAAATRQESLRRAVDRAPVPRPSLLRLLAVEPRMSYAEMAAAMDVPIERVGILRQRCLDHIRTNPHLIASHRIAKGAFMSRRLAPLGIPSIDFSRAVVTRPAGPVPAPGQERPQSGK